LAKIIDENKYLLDKLQNTKSSYNARKWENEFSKQSHIKDQISKNGNKFNKNPYFLHSLAT